MTDSLILALSRLNLSIQTEAGVIKRELAELGAVRGQCASRLARVTVALRRRGMDEEILRELTMIGMDLNPTTFSTVENQLNKIHNQQTLRPLGLRPFTVVKGSLGDGEVDCGLPGGRP